MGWAQPILAQVHAQDAQGGEIGLTFLQFSHIVTVQRGYPPPRVHMWHTALHRMALELPQAVPSVLPLQDVARHTPALILTVLPVHL